MASLINPTGWNDWVQSSFDAAGQLAASVRGLFTKQTDAERAAEKALREEQDRTIEAIKLASAKKETEKVKAYLNWQNLKVYLVKYWYIGAIVLLLIFARPLMRLFGIEKRTKVYRKRRSSVPRKVKIRSKSKPRKASTRTKSKGSSRGFRKRIGNTIYTSKRAWSEAMLRRRRRKAA